MAELVNQLLNIQRPVRQQRGLGDAQKQQQIANMLLSSGAKTNNPIIAALTGFFGTQAGISASEQFGALEQQQMAQEQARLSRSEARSDRQLDISEMGVRASRANAAATREAALMKDMMSRRTKIMDRAEKSTVPGFDFADAQVIPTVKAAEDMRESNELVTIMNKDIDRMRKLLEENGTEAFTLFGGEKKSMESLKSRMLTNYNRIADLGALAGADLALLEDIIPDPTAWLTSGGTTIEQFDILQSNLNENLSAQASTRGFVPKSSPQTSSAGRTVPFSALKAK